MGREINKQLLFKGIGRLALFMLVVNIGHRLILQPITNAIFFMALQTTGYQVLFNQDMLSFFTTPQAILATLLIIGVASYAAYFEFSVIVILSQYLKGGTLLSLKDAVKKALTTFFSLRGVSLIGYFIYVFIFLPISGMGLSSALFSRFQIPNFITGELAKNNWGSAVIVLIYALITLLFFLFIYTIPMMVLEQWRFFKAFKASISYVWKKKRQIYKLFALYGVVWLLVDWLPREIFFRFLHSTTISVEAIYQSYRLSLPTIGFGLIWLFYYLGKFVLMPVLLSIVVMSYTPKNQQVIDLKQEQIVDSKLSAAQKSMVVFGKRLTGKKGAAALLAVLLIVPTALSMYRMVESAEDLHEPIVIGHRGSVAGVENSLAAIQGAIDAKAEYAEIDILLSADGIPMVIHDDSLNRLAGIGKSVHELTAKELGQVVLKQNGMIGEIATLEEVIRLTKGKINLAVELKQHGHEEKNLVDEVAAVLQEYNLLEESIFLSLDYRLVDEMNTKHPETISGYCIFGGLGVLNPTVIRTMNIDFVFIEEWMATRENLMEFRRAWLPVYVWTVNQKESMRQLLDLGVLGLVTDYPAWGTETVDEFQKETNRIYLKNEDWERE
ncbi:glycerophosphoryl diester phosphodiesterase membrane domain-containing protein [uncultured Enterococcus sp.]|uniref:glycerophosphoryl diester phosphodiesterase membrane domain-containing protein n=1 Tax=uncultured Enterococcus sp. TaxID=167972 RepID=UPI002AA78A49|nr:glycerophosphoryl diester phosphodiesterase membrane domain-containing protein [uncultured Enterococcus sp.]